MQTSLAIARICARALIKGVTAEKATFSMVLSLRRVLLLSGQESDLVLADGLLRLSMRMTPTAEERMAAAASV